MTAHKGGAHKGLERKMGKMVTLYASIYHNTCYGIICTKEFPSVRVMP